MPLVMNVLSFVISYFYSVHHGHKFGQNLTIFWRYLNAMRLCPQNVDIKENNRHETAPVGMHNGPGSCLHIDEDHRGGTCRVLTQHHSTVQHPTPPHVLHKETKTTVQQMEMYKAKEYCT